MPNITIEIPPKILQRGASRRLLVVDPKEFEQELRQRWELDDVRESTRVAHREWKQGKAKLVQDLKELT